MRTIDLEATNLADEVTDGDLIGYSRPKDIVDDVALPVSRRRALLAYWGSDIHAVIGAPALRSFPFGVAVAIDEIFDALKALDGQYDLPPPVAIGLDRTSA